MQYIRALVGTALLTAALLLTGTITPHTANASSPATEILTIVNREREAVGAGPLTLCDELTVAAQRHAEDMVANNFLGHTGSDGSRSWDRIRAAGYDWNSTSENIAWGYATASSVMQGWMNSDGHRVNIVNPEFEHMGLYLHPTNNHWVQTFAVGDTCSNQPVRFPDMNADDRVTPADAVFV
ncbi:MAG: CAP domain-containing protein, partial [Chloroflexota bacterium]